MTTHHAQPCNCQTCETSRMTDEAAWREVDRLYGVPYEDTDQRLGGNDYITDESDYNSFLPED